MGSPPAKRRMTTRSGAPPANPPHPPTQSTSRLPNSITIDSDSDQDEDDDSDVQFEYDSDAPDDVEQDDADNELEMDEQEEQEEQDELNMDEGAVETIIISDDDELVPPPDVEPARRSTGKLSSRKQYLADVEALVQLYGSSLGERVTHFSKQSDETVQFSLVHPAFKRGLKLVIMTPEMAGYPISHQNICYSESEIGPDVQGVMAEISQLPPQADRSIAGLVQYLVSRLILNEPAPYANQQTQEDTDDESYEDDDALYGIGSTATGQSAAFLSALRSDFKDVLAAGFRPGFTRVSELDNIVSVSKKVNQLGVPLEALQAWDSSLITGEVRYLVLLMNFGAKYPVDPDNGTRGEVKFRVGLSPRYKPSKEAMASAFRSHSANTYTKNDFEAISLSKPIDSLFQDKFQEILLARRKNVALGWAGAEHHCLTPGRASEALDKKGVRAADKGEKIISGSYTLPDDPMAKAAPTKLSNNYPLLAFSYLIRRFVMCPRFCLICFKKIATDIVALKPFVCDSQLCLFQLISLGLGPSIEHEIKTNAPAVDLLIQLAFNAAREDGMKAEMQPQGLSLEVPAAPHLPWKKGDATTDFDTLSVPERNAGMAALINELPPVPEMKAWLDGDDLSESDRQLGRNRKLVDIRGGAVSNSAWKLLQWIVASNTSYLKQIEEEDELVVGVPKSFRQFRLVVGSPAKEHLLAENVKAAKTRSTNANKYPTLFAWHGSAVKNWHSILREGLHFKDTVNGRAYGHGVYFAKQGDVSLGTYAQFSSTTWKNAEFGIGKMAAICEIVNLPEEFVSSNPYFVVNKVDWIQCRYLLVQRGASTNYQPTDASGTDDATSADGLTKPHPLDPAHPLTLGNKQIGIPDIVPKLEALSNKLKDTKEELNQSDTELMKEPSIVIPDTPKCSKLKRALGLGGSRAEVAALLPQEHFEPCGPEILRLVRILPPPAHPNAGAARQIQSEMRALMKEQEKEGPVRAGFYFDFERSDGNLFNWIIEIPVGSFDPAIPLVKDMKAKNVTSLLFEIRFGESFPMSPPFFRIVYPRFLPFIHGGGGHVTGGGSICMDLLTATGWNPAYSIPSILLQIRMAISNLDPKPARLDQNYKQPYSMAEAIAGFERAASTHGWQVPAELHAITRTF